MKHKFSSILFMILIQCHCTYASVPMPHLLNERDFLIVESLVQLTDYFVGRITWQVSVIASIENDKLRDVVDVFLSNLNASWLIQSEFSLTEGITILFSHNISKFESLKQSTSFSYYIFLVDGNDMSDVDLDITLVKMMKRFWQLKMYRIVVLVALRNKVDFYSMEPFNEKHCAIVNEAVLINSWSFLRKTFDKSVSVFSSKRMVSNFHGCPLRAVIDTRPPESMVIVDGDNFVLQGPAAQMVKFLESKFNFTTNLTFLSKLSQVDRFGYVIIPGKSQRIKAIVESGKVAFGCGIFSHGMYNFPSLHLDNAAYSECFTWAAACGIGSVPSIWDNYVNEFSSFTWIMIAVVFMIAFLLNVFLESLMGPERHQNKKLTVLFGMYRNFIGQPEPNASSRNRLFKIIWLHYCFIILSIYFSSLGSFMTLPLIGKNVETLEQILKLDLKVIGTDATFKIFNTTTNENINAEVAKRFKIIRNASYDELIRILVDESNSIAFASKRLQLHYAQHRSDKVKSERPICTFDRCTVRYNASPLLFRRGSLLFRPFHSITQKAFESGILTRLWEIYEPKPTNKLIDAREKVFEIEKLYGALFAYFSGISLSILTLCCEFIMKYFISPFWSRRRLLKLKKRVEKNLS